MTLSAPWWRASKVFRLRPGLRSTSLFSSTGAEVDSFTTSDRLHDHWSCTGSATFSSACMPLVSWHPLLFICRPVSCGVYIDVNSTATRHRQVLSQLDLLRYWKAMSAYKNEVHLFLKHLDEKQPHRTLLHLVRSSVSLLRSTRAAVTRPPFLSPTFSLLPRVTSTSSF